MHRVGKLLVTVAALAAIAGPALAADVIVVPPPAPPPPPPIVEPAFVGPYWGVYGGYAALAGQGGAPFRGPVVGTQFGYNFEGSSTLRLGIEVETEYYRFATLVDAVLNGRIGVVMGNNDNILLYGQLGLGTRAPFIPIYAAGAGVEFLLNSGLAAFVEGRADFILGPGGFIGWSARAGVNYYADRDNADAAGDFDWHGMYLGAFLGGGQSGGGFGVGGVQVGYNFGNGPLIVGVEVETTHLFPFPVPTVDGTLNGRAGFAFGNILIYGEGGIGTMANIPVYTAGGGVEWAVGERMAIAAEGQAILAFGGGGFVGWQATGGINMHFGR